MIGKTFFILLFISCSGILSCSKSPSTTLIHPTPGPSFVMVVNASPDDSLLSLSYNRAKPGSQPTPVNYPGNSGYFSLDGAGQVELHLTSTVTMKQVLDTTISTNTLTYQTLFVLPGSNVNAFLVRDTLTAPKAGNAKVRFIHLSPDGPAVDITITGGTRIFSDVSYKTATGFKELVAGTYNLTVSVSDSFGLLSRQVPPVTILPGNFYTVVARGYYTSTGNHTVGVTVIENQP